MSPGHSLNPQLLVMYWAPAWIAAVNAGIIAAAFEPADSTSTM